MDNERNARSCLWMRVPARYIAAAFVLALAVLCGCGQDERTSPHGFQSRLVTVSPIHAAPEDPLHITFRTPYKIGDTTANGSKVRTQFGARTAQSYDNYHLLIYGPGGQRCHARLRFELGFLTEERPRRSRSIVVGPLRFGAARPRARTWCAGKYSGRVEYRQPDRTPPIPFEQLGSFRFSVGR